MRIAVASSDGKMVNQHFGKAREFHILEVNQGKVKLIEIRKSQPTCGTGEYGHAENAMKCTINLLSDCQAVLCSRIGEPAKREILEHGIQPLEARDFILDAVNKFIQQKENPHAC